HSAGRERDEHGAQPARSLARRRGMVLLSPAGVDGDHPHPRGEHLVPRLSSILANDRFMPRQFAQRGERLAFTTGIVALAIVASVLVWAYDGSVTGLIP